MVIDLTEEEWDYLQSKVIKEVCFADMGDKDMISIPKRDHRIARQLLEKFIKERK